MFVWTFDDVVTAIMLVFLAIFALIFVFMYLIGLLVAWFNRWKPYKGEEDKEWK